MDLIDPCAELLPRVINAELINKCIDEQLPSGEEGRLARMDGVKFEELETIRLEYLNILRIDSLWLLKSLTKLSLNNNYIEKIENLDSLIHLEQLDLSFNKISKIENLECLVKLEKLSFYENLIKTVQNMDSLKNLRIFSIGKNKIADKNNILYFRRFKNLTSLNMAENPCTKDENFRYYIAAFLPKISYYEYKNIKPEEITMGKELFREELMKLEVKEIKENQAREEKEREEQEAILNAVSFVEYLNTKHLFDEMFRNDPEGKILLRMGEEVDMFYSQYQESFLATCKQLFDIGQKHYALRQDEIDDFKSSFEEAQKKSQKESIEQKELFNKDRLAMVAEIKFMVTKMDPESPNHDPTFSPDNFMFALDEYYIRMDQLCHKYWKILMGMELILYEQMEELLSTFDHTLGEMINNFLEEAQAAFSLIRSLEVVYVENVSDVANKIMNTINIGGSVTMIDGEVLDLVADKDVLTNAITATHDVHMQVIDNREDTLTTRAKTWYQNLVNDMNREEITRNRNKVLEIQHFFEIRKEEFDLTVQDLIPKYNEDSEENFEME